MDFELSSSTSLCRQINSLGIKSWKELCIFIASLPYGRNANRADLSLVLSERQGTCSSKHGLLKLIAEEHGKSEIKLIIGIYKMTEVNTLGIGDVLYHHKLSHIPEAHCYLKIDAERYDYTSPNSDFKTIASDLLREIEIRAEQVIHDKVELHQSYLRNWRKSCGESRNLDELWDIREACILRLSTMSKD